MRFDCGNGSIWNGDCLELMRHVPDGSADMVLCDLPYGTTACAWDTVIPFDFLWSEYWRVAKPNAAVVLTASQPFTTALINSQIERFKYELIWSKNQPSGFLNAKIAPMKNHENICVFYRDQPTYNPQLVASNNVNAKSAGRNNRKLQSSDVYRKLDYTPATQEAKELVNPRSIIENVKCIANNSGVRIHPTQKPVGLFDYLIKTYTNPGDFVLDNCSGSGTTAVAAQSSGRRWLCIEKDLAYYLASCGRVHAAVSA